MTPNDGGPAFPKATPYAPYDRDVDGMSLRDWFAGQALAGMLSQPDERTCPKDRIHELETWRIEQYKADAAMCYTYADAMLAAHVGAK